VEYCATNWPSRVLIGNSQSASLMSSSAFIPVAR
jgi:hypothetical protein